MNMFELRVEVETIGVIRCSVCVTVCELNWLNSSVVKKFEKDVVRSGIFSVITVNDF